MTKKSNRQEAIGVSLKAAKMQAPVDIVLQHTPTGSAVSLACDWRVHKNCGGDRT